MSEVHRSFSLEFKRAALARLAAGELVSAALLLTPVLVGASWVVAGASPSADV